MQKLIFGTLLATLVSGCIITDGAYEVEVGYITTSWSFHDVAGADLGCPAGFNTAEVTAVSRELGDVFIDLYNCDARGGSAPYPLGTYDVTIAITSAGGSQLYGQSLTHTLDIVRADAELREDFIDDGGRVIFDWVLQDATSNEPVSCTEPSIDAVSVVFDDAALATTFPCGDQFGISNPVVAGAHTLSIAVLGRDGELLGQPETEAITMRDRNHYVDLGTVTLPVGNPPTPLRPDQGRARPPG